MSRDERETAAEELSPGLRALARAFAPQDACGRDTAAAEFVAVPSPAAARFLVPGRDRRTAVRVLADYNRLRPARVRAVRAALAAALAVAPAATWNSGRVLLPGSAALLEHLAEVLGEPGLSMGLGVPADDPNAKPTLQLFAPGGRPVGYAKFGWTPPTAALVRAEAEGLALGAQCGPSVHVPEVLATTEWRGAPVTVVAPLPRGVRRWPDDDLPPAPGVLLDLAGPVRARPVTTGAWWAQAQRTSTAVRADPGLSWLAATCEAALEHLAGATEALTVPLGTWHGDLTPWNVCLDGEDVHVIDWEHAGREVPLGFDVAHWAFQVELVLRGSSAADAADRAVHAVVEHGPGLGLDEAHARWAAHAYLVEMTLRTFRLRDGGGSWNPALYPDLPAALTQLLGLGPVPAADAPPPGGRGPASGPQDVPS